MAVRMCLDRAFHCINAELGIKSGHALIPLRSREELISNRRDEVVSLGRTSGVRDATRKGC